MTSVYDLPLSRAQSNWQGSGSSISADLPYGHDGDFIGHALPLAIGDDIQLGLQPVLRATDEKRALVVGLTFLFLALA